MSRRRSPPLNLPKKPLLIILSGPSGVGKDALLNRMKEFKYPLEYITTATTRLRRAGERNHIDYHFIAPEKFQDMIKQGELLEYAKVYGNWYGVPKMQTATEEIKQSSLFDYVVYSQRDEIDSAVMDIIAIITAEKCRVTPREINLE